MSSRPNNLAPLPRRVLALQAAIISSILAMGALAPSPGQPTFYLPLVPVQQRAALSWALAHGAYVMGTGPAGGVIIGGAPSGLALRAAREGTLTLAVPSLLCRQPESSNHG